jgi:hypothetical protein
MAIRENHSRKAVVTEWNWAEGAFRWVHKGHYTAGPRSGQPCVQKVFKSGSVFEDSYFRHDMDVTRTVQRLVSEFNQAGILGDDFRVMLNKPEVWMFVDTGERTLVEPHIEGFRKFNSNTGWVDRRTPWDRVMQAVSHFSYHQSGGGFVLCDLQGGLYDDAAVITDPVVLSRDHRFGPTDLGPDGISSFFSTHVCNEYCRSNWARPRRPVQYFTPVAGTTMTEHDPAYPALSDQRRYN